MRRSRVVETKYKGYVIKPSVAGFKVYRKDYYLEVYPTLQIAKSRIDKVAEKEAARKSRTEDSSEESQELDQLGLF